MLHRALLALIFVALLVAAPIHARKTVVTATLSGVVNKPDGTPQANARVYLQPSDGRPPRITQTDATGHFQFSNVRVGIYDVRAQASGFVSELVRNITVQAKEQVTVDLQLKPPAPAKPKTP